MVLKVSHNNLHSGCRFVNPSCSKLFYLVLFLVLVWVVVLYSYFCEDQLEEVGLPVGVCAFTVS